MVLKGVRGGFNETEVLEELKSLNLKDVAIMKVSKMVFNRNTPERYHFIITTTTESNMPSLTCIKKVLAKPENKMGKTEEETDLPMYKVPTNWTCQLELFLRTSMRKVCKAAQRVRLSPR